MKNRPIIVAGACLVALWGLAALGKPVLQRYDDRFPDAFNDVVLHERVKTFATAADAPEWGDGEGKFVLPEWVPEDATGVKVKVQTDGNAELIRYDAHGSALDESKAKKCPSPYGDPPVLRGDWWTPEPGWNAGRADCSEQYQYRILTEGDRVYAWSNGNLTGR